MSTKIKKSSYPENHSANDFQCFGPPATKDGDFEQTMIADCGCFTQDGKDTNKYYHGAVVQSKINQKWYAYFEWGRQGAKNPQFQMIECTSKEHAIREYSSQLHEKNDKRGQWVKHPTLGNILQAKAGKDCYLVRPQATRSTGLPDARTIRTNDGKTPVAKTPSKKTINIDPQTAKLMRDINVATVSFARGAMTDDSLPTQYAIDEARDILGAALNRVKTIGDDIENQVKDSELKQLTSLIYGRIPKKKDRGAAAETWILSKDNISVWQQDLNAFESALNAVVSDALDNTSDPFGGMDLKLEYLPPNSTIGQFIHNWLPNATRNKHSHLGKMNVKNVWYVERGGDQQKLSAQQSKIGLVSTRERPLHQPSVRPDLCSGDRDLYSSSHTALLIHGTRSVNVRGILDKALMLPKQLVGVAITGAMFGPGLYFADDWKKSAGYTSLSGGYYSAGAGGIAGRGAFMFLADVVLGDPFVAPRASGYTCPPNNRHCVFGKAGFSGVQNNEWIVFNTNQHRIRYLVEFDV